MAEYKNMFEQQKELITEYGAKLKIEKDIITDLFFPTLDQLKDLCQKEIEPHVAKWDEIGVKLENGKAIFPPGVDNAYKKLVSDPRGLRLHESLLPEEDGGVGFPALMLGAMMEIIGYYDLAMNVTVGLAATLVEAISLYPTEHLKSKYYPRLKDGVPGYVAFTEPQAGSNLRNISTTSVEDGDNFIVKGTKIFISNAGFGEIGIVLAKNVVNGKEEGTNAFIVDSDMKNADDPSKPGIYCSRLEEKMGLHASATGVLEFNVVVPKENLLGPRGKGYQTVLERLLGMRMGVAFQSSALAERAFSYAKDYSVERVQFGKAIGTFPGVSNKIRGMELNLTKMRRFGFEAAYVLSQYQLKKPIKSKYLKLSTDEEKTLQEFSGQYNRAMVNHAISKAKMFNSEVGYMICDDAIQIFGGNGYVKEYNVERIVRDFRVLRIYEGTSEIQEYILNRSKGVVMAKNLDELTEIAMSQGGIPMPEEAPMDYSELFYRRYPSVMDVYLMEDGKNRFIFD